MKAATPFECMAEKIAKEGVKLVEVTEENIGYLTELYEDGDGPSMGLAEPFVGATIDADQLIGLVANVKHKNSEMC